MAENLQTSADTALEIIESSLSIAMRIRFVRGALKVLFITDNVRRLGYEPWEFTGGSLRWADIIHPDDLETVRQTAQKAEAEGHETLEISYRAISASGRILWVLHSAAVHRRANGAPLYWNGVATVCSLLEDKQTQIDTALAQHRALNDLMQCFHMADLTEAFEAVLGRVGQYLGVARAALFENEDNHRHCRLVYEWHQAALPPLAANGAVTLSYQGDLNAPGSAPWPQEDGAFMPIASLGVEQATLIPVVRADQPYGLLCLGDGTPPQKWPGGAHSFMQGVANLVSSLLVRKDYEDSIRHMAHYDQLTGLMNRYRFDIYLRRAINDAREHRRQGYVLFIDMDDFKVINDGYGHDYGDALLMEVADYLQRRFGERAKLFRFGGDEFVVLIEHHHAGDAQQIVDDILTRARRPWMVMDGEFYCTLSVGVVRYPDGRDGVTEIVKNADIALYQAKDMGKNSYVFYNRTLSDHSLQRAETERRMREAIENGCQDFKVYYQPLVSRGGKITGAEALVRWQDGDTLVPPGEFIPLAEYLGLIVPLGEYVLREAAQECRRINALIPNFTISVNVSVRQFQQRDFLARVDDIIRHSGVNPNNVIIEVTEGLVVQDIARMRDVLDELRALGLKIAMDDFGTGYSSLNNMRELPLDVIKIDRSFVRDVATDPYSKTFVRLIADLCHAMNRKVCVEGVETGTQYDYCVDCQVDTIQGYYFFGPMPQDKLRKLLSGPGDAATSITVV